ncbi:hypothetical protein ABPG74_013327 [Tetrahymena malaccensis]
METQQCFFQKNVLLNKFFISGTYSRSFLSKEKSTANVDMQCQTITQKNQKVKKCKDFFFQKHAEIIIFQKHFFYGTKSFSKILQKIQEIYKSFQMNQHILSKKLMTLFKNNQHTIFQKNQSNTLIKKTPSNKFMFVKTNKQSYINQLLACCFSALSWKCFLCLSLSLVAQELYLKGQKKKIFMIDQNYQNHLQMTEISLQKLQQQNESND